MAASNSITLPGPHLTSNFLGQTHLIHPPQRQSLALYKKATHHSPAICAKFNLFEIMGGRGLCNGEQGLQKELKRNIDEQPQPDNNKKHDSSSDSAQSAINDVPEDAFEKELMGLTGGFPGGEKGLKKFIQENPPPRKLSATGAEKITDLISTDKPKPPKLPLLMPGMIAIVKNPNNPYYMYCGIVQRITDGKAGVLFEGGNWDRLITFRLEELERREKGPPMKNPKSAVLEPLLENKS